MCFSAEFLSSKLAACSLALSFRVHLHPIWHLPLSSWLLWHQTPSLMQPSNQRSPCCYPPLSIKDSSQHYPREQRKAKDDDQAWSLPYHQGHVRLLWKSWRLRREVLWWGIKHALHFQAWTKGKRKCFSMSLSKSRVVERKRDLALFSLPSKEHGWKDCAGERWGGWVLPSYSDPLASHTFAE